MRKVTELEDEKKDWHSQKNVVSRVTRSLLAKRSERRQHKINEDRLMSFCRSGGRRYIS